MSMSFYYGIVASVSVSIINIAALQRTNQSSIRIVEPSSIFKMAVTEQKLTFARQDILTARIDEVVLATAVRCLIPILYDKNKKK